MSQSTNTSAINFCDVFNLSFETKKGLYRHQSYDLKHRNYWRKCLSLKKKKSWGRCIIRMKMIILLKLSILYKLNLKEYHNSKTTSTLKLNRRSRFTDMNVKNVMKNLGIK